ncbi:MAG: hypothetical protein WC866_00350 [Patescibacteria group bacterium]|jgi:hypothetical protein
MTATKFLQTRQVERRLLAALKGRRETFTAHQLYELCGIPLKDENAKFTLRQVATELAKSRKIKAIGGGMYRSMEPDAEREEIPEPVPEPVVVVEEVAAEELVDDAHSEPDFESGDEEEVVVEEAGSNTETAQPKIDPIEAPASRAPQGAFRAWLLGYLRPNVILSTKDILNRALEAKVAVSRQSGQLSLGAMVKRGDVRRVRKGYFSLPQSPTSASQSMSVVAVPDAPKDPPVLSVVPNPPVESERKPEPVVEEGSSVDADLPPDPETGALQEEVKLPTPKRKAARSEEDVFMRIDRMFREKDRLLRQRIVEGEAYKKELTAMIRKGERQLIEIERCCVDARSLLLQVTKARQELTRLERSLRPRKRR